VRHPGLFVLTKLWYSKMHYQGSIRLLAHFSFLGLCLTLILCLATESSQHRGKEVRHVIHARWCIILLLETSIVLKPPLASQIEPSTWISTRQKQDGIVHLINFHAFQHFKENHVGWETRHVLRGLSDIWQLCPCTVRRTSVIPSLSRLRYRKSKQRCSPISQRSFPIC
jgi:hypothetical protein